MEMFHVAPIVRKPSLHLLASPLRTLRRMPQPRARLWLEGALGILKAQAFGLVLFKSLSGLLLNESQEIHQHG
jgi:hypothetical protein